MAVDNIAKIYSATSLDQFFESHPYGVDNWSRDVAKQNCAMLSRVATEFISKQKQSYPPSAFRVLDARIQVFCTALQQAISFSLHH
jgi:hypothetical protein